MNTFPDLLRNIETPTLLLDEEKCRRNISNLASRAGRLGIRFRPHFKTHQSREVGRWFRDYGVEAITVSSLQMASYFAGDDWRDITVAFPVNIREERRINALAGRVRLNLLAESLESLQALDRMLQSPVRFFIKADTGAGRTGLRPEQQEAVDRMLDFAAGSPRLEFAGFLSHAGQTYRERGRAGIERVNRQVLEVMHRFRDAYRSAYPGLLLSLGDTPSCSVLEEFPGIDELRPGNFVFYDLWQTEIGSCTGQDVAVALACPVVALHPERNEIVLYGGAVHFSKDRLLHPTGGDTYGAVVGWTDEGWALPPEGSYLRALSQEHGIVRATPELMHSTRVGDLLGVLPVHSCLTANLMKSYLTLTGERIGMMEGWNAGMLE